MPEDDAVEAPVEATEPVEGEVESGGGESEVVSEVSEPKSYVDLDQYGNHYVPVQVDGEELEVPLSDLRGGYMRQADYTRKTQEVAAEREQLREAQAIARALEVDPQGTLQVLQEWYASDDDDTTDEELDPQERAIKEIQGRFEEMDRKAADEALEAELQQYEERYGVPADDLLEFAVTNQIPNLEWAYSVMAQGKAQAEAQAAEQRQKAEDGRLAAKQGAAMVEGGVDRSSGMSGAPTGDRESVKTLADAFALAERQLGSM